MIVEWRDAGGKSQSVVGDLVEFRDDGTVEVYAFRALDQGRGEMGLVGILQLEPKDRLGRVTVT